MINLNYLKNKNNNNKQIIIIIIIQKNINRKNLKIILSLKNSAFIIL